MLSENIIYSVDEMKKFYYHLVHPLDLDEDKGLLLFLTSRKKYYPEFIRDYVKSDNFLSKYFFKFNDEDMFTLAVKKLNLDLTSYLIKLKLQPFEFFNLPTETQNKITEYLGKFYIFHDYIDNSGEKKLVIHFHPPVDTIAVYIDLNPKSAMAGTMKAMKQAMKQIEDMTHLNKQITEMLLSGVTEYHPEIKKRLEEVKRIQKWFKNFKSVWLSEIHRSNAEHPPYFQIDVDTKDKELLEKITSTVKPVTAIIETKNGYHIIYKNKRELKKQAYTNFGHLQPKIEIQSEVMTPLPGTLQGGFKVRMIYP